MHSTHLRHLLHLLRYQAGILICCLLLSAYACSAQQYLNLADHDNKPYYFGITLSYNQAYYKLSHDPRFLQGDSVLVVEPPKSAGFNLGLLGNLLLTKQFDLRFNPSLVFAEKNLSYRMKQDSTDQVKNIESVLLSFPLQVKFKSDRIGNFRLYTMAGIKADYDLATNSHDRLADDIVKLSKFDWGYEAGVGFEFYFPNFIFSPEIKISNGVGNIHVMEQHKVYSNIIQELKSRMVVISIHLEG